jgi:lysophospholipase L1-like esterase
MTLAGTPPAQAEPKKPNEVVAAGRVAASSSSGAYKIVVLGDSYSAGNGAGKYTGAKGCYRSKNNYGNQYGRYLAKRYNYKVTVTTEACSGAVTDDYWNSKAGRRPEREALDGSTDLVLMTFGGNDLGFGDIVTQCLVGVTDDEQKCAGYLSLASGLVANGSLSSRLHALLQDAADRTRTDTKIVLVGYPYLEIDRNLEFGSVALGESLYALSDAGEKAQADVVAELNAATGTDRFVFVSTKALFEGFSSWLPKADRHRHELYKAKKNKYRWMVHPVSDASIVTKATYYHPNPKGWSHESQLLERRLDPHSSFSLGTDYIGSFHFGTRFPSVEGALRQHYGHPDVVYEDEGCPMNPAWARVLHWKGLWVRFEAEQTTPTTAMDLTGWGITTARGKPSAARPEGRLPLRTSFSALRKTYPAITIEDAFGGGPYFTDLPVGATYFWTTSKGKKVESLEAGAVHWCE